MCACNLNPKAGVAKVKFSTAVHGTSLQRIIDGSRWKRDVVLALPSLLSNEKSSNYRRIVTCPGLNLEAGD